MLAICQAYINKIKQTSQNAQVPPPPPSLSAHNKFLANSHQLAVKYCQLLVVHSFSLPVTIC